MHQNFLHRNGYYNSTSPSLPQKKKKIGNYGYYFLVLITLLATKNIPDKDSQVEEEKKILIYFSRITFQLEVGIHNSHKISVYSLII